MKMWIFAVLFVLPVFYLSAQKNVYFVERRPLNNGALNICGEAAILSLHYERLHFLNRHFCLAGKLGIGFDEPTIKYLFGNRSPPEEYFITIPHHLTCNLGPGKHLFEFGLGGSLVLEGSAHHYLFYPLAGYRLQPLKTNRIHLRIYGSLPVSGNEDIRDQFTPWGSSIGISF